MACIVRLLSVKKNIQIPPRLIFITVKNECLYAFAEYFEKAMDKYHAPHERIVGEGMCHCYPLLRFFREGREAQDKMIALLQF